MRMYLEPDGGQGGDGAGQQPQNQNQPQNQQPPAFDYEKLANLVAGKQNVTEDTVLKSYFKQQGLSEDEMKQAVASFKQQKAASQPDVNALQTQIAEAQAEAKKSAVENAAILEAVGMGLDAKTIPYVLKMADLSAVTGQDGKINQETLKNAINKVLEDVPQLKPVTAENKGFQIGGNGGQQQNNASEAALKAAFGMLNDAPLLAGHSKMLEMVVSRFSSDRLT